MRQTWDTYGVSAATQDKLLGELEAGQLWDSVSGAQPVQSSTSTAKSVQTTVDTFADGSIKVTQLQKPAPVTTTPGGVHINASIGGCKTLSSSHYDATIQCTVSTNVVLASAAYLVTYHQVQGGNSSITNHSTITTECFAGSCTDKRVVVGRKTQSGSNSAYITGFWTWDGGSKGSKDFWLEFDVKGSSTKASNN
ncbi:hypothetical protein [Curtobacterium sp. L1-20]|uniref:hypothetical protein n=1 Tax=Curtobacterium sp. L1-20 TaxID=3138181 RepID=UPI003B524F9A